MERTAVTARVFEHFPNLTNSEALALALCSTMQRGTETVSVLFGSAIEIEMFEKTKSGMALSDAELTALFAHGVSSSGDVRHSTNSTTIGTPCTKKTTTIDEPLRSQMSAALIETLGEVEQAAKWARPSTMNAVAFALHCDGACEKIDGLLGGLLKSDERRIAGLASDLEDDESQDVLRISQIIAHLAGV